jgi:hypothetical protein
VKRFFIALVLLLIAGFFLRPRSAEHATNDWASSSPNRAMARPSSGPSTAAQNRTDESASSLSLASQARNAPSANGPSGALPAPTTEAGALALLQSSSREAWDLRRDDFSKTIRTLVHGELAADGTPRLSADDFVKTYSQALFGVDPGRLQFQTEEVTDRTRLIYQEMIDGIPVYGGTLTLFYENGALTRVQNDLQPGEIEDGSTDFTVAQAFDRYKSFHSDRFDIELKPNTAMRTILYPNGKTFVYAYEFVTNEAAKGAANARSYRVIYDADNRFVIDRRPTAIQ